MAHLQSDLDSGAVVLTAADPKAQDRHPDAERLFHRRLQGGARQEFQMLPTSDSRLA